MKVRKLNTRESLMELKSGNRLIVHWKDGSPAARNGEPITMTMIWGVNHIDEVIVRKKDNLYFSIDNFVNGCSIA
jgi:hypothetical protein